MGPGKEIWQSLATPAELAVRDHGLEAAMAKYVDFKIQDMLVFPKDAAQVLEEEELGLVLSSPSLVPHTPKPFKSPPSLPMASPRALATPRSTIRHRSSAAFKTPTRGGQRLDDSDSEDNPRSSSMDVTLWKHGVSWQDSPSQPSGFDGRPLASTESERESVRGMPRLNSFSLTPAPLYEPRSARRTRADSRSPGAIIAKPKSVVSHSVPACMPAYFQ